PAAFSVACILPSPALLSIANHSNRFEKTKQKQALSPLPPLATLAVAGSGCVLYGFPRPPARGLVKKFQEDDRPMTER
ncbi:hypothetical protein, partial [Billgrantia endophytica]|uniref:hypothetical protein n=1 Tax=Billgrantia endophytica TaxID=2033802 RepID=UPI00197AAC69